MLDCYPKMMMKCPTGFFHCKTSGECISSDRVCDFSHDCHDNSDEEQCEHKNLPNCDFEYSMCSWHELDGTNDWSIKTAAEAYPFSFSRDHTTSLSSGRFLYTNGNAKLMGPIFKATNSCMVRIYYSTKNLGYKNEKLIVGTLTNTNGNVKPVWTSPLNRFYQLTSQEFERQTIVFSETDNFQVVIQSYSDSYTGFAVDDISFSDDCIGAQELLPSIVDPSEHTKYCQPNEFKCKTSEICIPINLKCDFVSNCKDGSDEENCGNCDYEDGQKGLCGWVTHSSRKWDIVKANETSEFPAEDSTLFSSGGHYLMASQSSQTSWLASPNLGPTGPNCTFSFYYYMNSTDEQGNLEVVIGYQGNQKEEIIRPKPFNASNPWIKHQISLGTVSGKFTVYIISYNEDSFVAIDDIDFRGCRPDHSIIEGVNCTFNNGPCGWHSTVQMQTFWSIDKLIKNVGPSLDHDRTISPIAYLYTSQLNQSTSSNLTSDPIPLQNTPLCLKFWYYIFGENVGSLSMTKLESNTPPLLLFHHAGSQSNQWHRAKINIPSTYHQFKIQFEGVMKGPTLEGIAIDDITYHDFSCERGLYEIFDFENIEDSDLWQDPENNWKVNDGMHCDLVPYDHTWQTKQGKFAYVNTFGNSLLRGPPMDGNIHSQPCLSFWYYTKGKEVVLTARIYFNDNVRDYKEIFYYDPTAETSSNWVKQQITIPQLAYTKYKLVIHAVIDSKTSVIAIDDIMVTPEGCPVPGSCNFETDLCSWSKKSKENFDWLRTSSLIPTQIAGPGYDVTTQSPEGWYIVADASKENVNKEAVLVSEFISKTSSICLSFYYYINSTANTQLIVALTEDNRDTIVCLKNKTQYWTKYEKQLTSEKFVMMDLEHFQFYFFAKINGDTGYVAVDEISFRPSCYIPTTTVAPVTPLPPREFSCNFETNCSLEMEKWNVFKPNDSCGLTCPIHDHSLSFGIGHYALTNNKVTNKGFAKMTINGFTLDKRSSCLRFWFFIAAMDSKTSLGIRLSKMNESESILYWQRSGRQGLTWNLAEMSLGQSYAGLDIQFYANMAAEVDEAIAVDDISISSGECNTAEFSSLDFENNDTRILFEPYDSWRVSKAYKVSSRLVDHTLRTAYGNVVYQYNNAENSNVVISNVKGGTKCIQLWYMFMYKYLSRTASAEIGTRKQFGSLITQSKVFFGLTWNTWFFTQLTDSDQYSHEIVIKAYKQTNLIIDDIKIVPGQCKDPGFCDFESGMCGWKNDYRNSFNWFISSPYLINDPKLPSTDVTLNTTQGSYLIVDPVKKQVGATAKLISKSFAASAYYRIQFYYYVEGGSFTVQTSYYRPSYMVRTIFNSTAISTGGSWYLASAKTSYIGYAVFKIIAEIGDVNDIIIIDNIEVQSQKTPFPKKPVDEFDCQNNQSISIDKVCDFNPDCRDGRDESVCGSCDFESNSCAWLPVNKNKYTSCAKRVPSSNHSSHPSSDHTFLSKAKIGHYYMCTSNRLTDRQIYLETSSIYYYKKSSPKCVFTFWYIMKDNAETNSIHVSLHTKAEKGGRYRQYSIQTTNWTKLDVVIGAVVEKFRIQIHPVMKGSFVMDDITTKNCGYVNSPSCDSTQMLCGGEIRVCIEKHSICDTVNDCGDSWDERQCDLPKMCNFDSNLEGCKFDVHNDDPSYTWKIIYGKYNNMTGPSTDHTVGFDDRGKYAIAHGGHINMPGKATSLLTQNFTRAHGETCELRFFYYMYGKNVDSLTLDYRNSSIPKWTNLLTKTGDYGQAWHKAVVSLQRDEYFQFRFHAKLGSDRLSAIAIDDITFSSGCTIYDNQLPPPRFYCISGQPSFIPLSKTCDFKADCQDHSDEKNCPSLCDFEDDTICKWKCNSTSRYDVITAATHVPSIDHSVGNKSGHYLTFANLNSTFYLISPEFRNSSSYCLFSVWFANLAADDSVNVFFESEKQTMKLGRLVNEIKHPSWQKAIFGIGRRSNSFKISFRITELTSVVLDDLEFSICNLPVASRICPSGNYRCKGTDACIRNSLICDLSDDCGDNSDENAKLCNTLVETETFENQSDIIFVSSTPPKLHGAEWISITSDQRSFEDTGPSFDHTYLNSSGHFMMTNFKYPFPKDQQAWLISKNAYSPSLSLNPCIITFYYNMYGKNVNKFGIYIKYYEDNDEIKLQWEKIGDQGEAWFRHRHTFVESQPFKIVLVANSPNGYSGQIAIDDISLHLTCRKTGSHLPYFPTTTVKTTTTPKPVTTTKAPTTTPKIVTTTKVTKYTKALTTRSTSTLPTATTTKVTPRTKIIGTTSATKSLFTTSKTTHHTTTLAPCNPREFFCNDPQRKCIPNLLLCDGINDCPNKHDELLSNCPRTKCTKGSYYCSVSQKCLDESLICDGKLDCDDGSDESLCSSCPKYFCINGGSCNIMKKQPHCHCISGKDGNRCNLDAAVTSTMMTTTKKFIISSGGSSEKLNANSKLKSGAISGIVIGVLVLIMVGAGLVYIFYFKKRRTNLQNENPLTRSMENPMFDAMDDTLDINFEHPIKEEVVPQRKKRSKRKEKASKSFENPSFTDFSDLNDTSNA